MGSRCWLKATSARLPRRERSGAGQCHSRGGFLAFVKSAAILELNALAAAGIHRLPEGRRVLAEHLDRLVLPLDRRVEVPDLRARGGECVQTIWILPVRELAGTGGFAQGPSAVAEVRLVAGRENASERR